jgi:NTP pyrophosphatase (non-canonical NTP hydrolase)
MKTDSRVDSLPGSLILNPDEASIEEYAEAIGNIWPLDKDRPIWLLWIHVLSHATLVCEEVRKNRWHKVAKELAEVLVWWLTFVRRVTQPPSRKTSEADKLVPYIGTTPSDIVWFKYPSVCPVCFGRWLTENCKDTSEASLLVSQNIKKIKMFFKENPNCTCLAAKQGVEERDEAFKRVTKQCLHEYARRTRKVKRPHSLRGMAEMLNLIFANNIEVLSVEEIAFHLLEEVGEVSKSLAILYMQDIQNVEEEGFLQDRRDRVVDFAEELADVFSWSVALLAKIYRFLECAAQFAAEYKTVEGMPELVRGNLERTRNIVDLIWTIYGKGSILVCEQCREFPCNPAHPAHEGKRGQLGGKKLAPEICELLLAGSALS